MDAPSGSSGSVGEELLGDARKVGDSLKDRLYSAVDARKGEGTNQAKTLSSALDNTANELGPDTPAWIKSALQQGADRLQRFAATIEQTDSRELTRTVRQLATDHPATFLAGCALAGFAAARLFKAGASDSADETASSGELYEPYAPASGEGDQSIMSFAGREDASEAGAAADAGGAS